MAQPPTPKLPRKVTTTPAKYLPANPTDSSSSSSLSRPLSTSEYNWRDHLNIDTLLSAAQKSIFHPFVAWMIPLGLRAMITPYDHPTMRLAIGWAVMVSVVWVGLWVDQGLERWVEGQGKGARGVSGEDSKDGEEDEDSDDGEGTEELVVITGGKGGLGRMLVEIYKLRGASVAVLDSKVDGKEEEEETGEGGGDVKFYQCDVGDLGQVRGCCERVERDFGMAPTVLINNAGIVNGKTLLDLSEQDITSCVQTNLLSHFWLIKTLLPGMLKARRGTIVTISSVLGKLGASHLSDYTTTKSALLALHSSLTAELSPASPGPRAGRIKTLLVTPGQLSTPLFAGVQTPSRFWAPVVDAKDLAKEIVKRVDGGRGGEVSLPEYARWVWVMEGLPRGVRACFRRWSGVDEAMGRREEKGKER